MNPIQTWVPGHTVGQYVLARELARGGMGEIWLARQSGAPEFERLVVLKRVISSGGDDSSAMTMFLDEARIASKLSHPNIVQVFDLGRDGGSVFLVMEYLAGQTLSRFARKMVETQGRVPASLAVDAVAAAAKGLGYAHRRVDLEGKPLHIVHRDVSPQNLFVTYDGQVKVLDFGIARAAGRMGRTLTGVIKGKVAYMSPEQAGGGGVEVTGAADVYALGIILFELLTGTRLYKGLDDMGVLRRLAISARAPLPSTRGAVDPDLEALVVRALEPEPSDRFPDGQAFFEALEGWARAHPPGADEPTLQAAMQKLFAADVDALGEFHRQAAATPALASNPSMPNRTVATRVREGAPISLRGPVGPSSMITETTSSPAREPVAPGPRSMAVPAGLAALAIGLVGVGLVLWNRAPTVTPAPTVLAATPPIVAQKPDPPPVPVAAAPVASPFEEEAPPPRPARPVPAPRVSPGAISLNTEPWTRVFLGKKALGDTPLISVPLPSGNHRLRLVNEDEHIDTVIDVTIKANETTVKKFVF